jgi:hypothetical protein
VRTLRADTEAAAGRLREVCFRADDQGIRCVVAGRAGRGGGVAGRGGGAARRGGGARLGGDAGRGGAGRARESACGEAEARVLQGALCERGRGAPGGLSLPRYDSETYQ